MTRFLPGDWSRVCRTYRRSCRELSFSPSLLRLVRFTSVR